MIEKKYITKDSFWLNNFQPGKARSSLDKDLNIDVAIIGSGITGLITAYLLAKAGKKVAVFEQDVLIKNTTTAYSTGFLSYYLDQKSSLKVQEAAKSAIDLIETIIQEEKIDCEFKRCSLFICAPGKINDCNKFDNHAKFHPVKFMQAMVIILDKLGVQFFENTKVLSIKGENPVILETAKGKVQAKYAVLAKNSHQGKKYPLSLDATYVLVADIFKNTLPEGIYIDTKDPYNYFRIDGQRIILGGEDHSLDLILNEAEQFIKIEENLKKLVGENNYKITHQWTGQIVNTIDGSPYIGESLGNKYQLLSAGHGGDGLVLGALSAIINTDIILNKKNKYAAIFTPKRLNSKCQLIKKGLSAIKSFYTGRKNLDQIDLNKISFGIGTVGIMNNKKVAIYKDEKGNIIKLSAVCSHLGCIVHWNNKAKTWDCPCHNSRFKANGEVINGPAKKYLSNLTENIR